MKIGRCFLSNVIPSYNLPYALLTVDLCLFFFLSFFAAAAAAADAIAPSTSVVVMQRNNTPTNRVKVRLLLQSNGGGGGGLKAQVPSSTCVNNTHTHRRRHTREQRKSTTVPLAFCTLCSRVQQRNQPPWRDPTQSPSPSTAVTRQKNITNYYLGLKKQNKTKRKIVV